MRPTPLQSRMLALGILGLVAVACVFVIVLPVMNAFSDQQDGIEQSTRLIAFYQAELAARPQLESDFAQMQQSQLSTANLIDGKNADLAAANLQSTVKSLVEQESGQVRSAENLPPTIDHGLQAIAIQYDVSLPLSHLKDATYQLETSTPYLFLDNVDIRMAESWQTEGSPDDPAPLEIRWTVRGYRWTKRP